MPKLKLVSKKIRKDSSYKPSLVDVKSGVKKASPTSPSKMSATRSSLRQQQKEPESGPLPGTWEKYESTKDTGDPEYKGELSIAVNADGIACKRRWRTNVKTDERVLWAALNDRGADHFYPGQIIRVMDCRPMTDLKAPFDERNTASHTDGPVNAKMRPMVILWKTKRGLLCLPLRGEKLEENGTMIKEPEIWNEFISLTEEHDKEWESKTPGPPLIYISHPPSHPDDEKFSGRSYIDLASPTRINMIYEMKTNLGHLSGAQYCRLVHAYIAAQSQFRKNAFEEFGEVAELPDPTTWPPSEPHWKLRLVRMDTKVPKLDKTKTYKLVGP